MALDSFLSRKQSDHTYISDGVVKLAYLDYENFIQVLSEFPLDYENYIKQKDNINIYQSFELVNM